MKYLSTIIALFLSVIIYAQIKVTGVVKSRDLNKPLEFVEIYKSNGRLLNKTNADGEFQFLTNNVKGKLTFYMEGYHILDKIIDYNNTENLVIKLTPLAEVLTEVEIIANKRKVFALKQLKSVEGTAIFEGKKSEVILIDQLVGSKGTNNARQIFSQIVGLNIYENDDAGLQLNIGGRGLDPNRTANFNTRQNGYDMSADVLGYPESYYTPPSDALDEIQVVRGAASLQYGTQFGGLINFKFRTPPKNKGFELVTRQSVGSNGLFNSFNSVAGTLGKIGYYGYVNYKKGDGFRSNSEFNSVNIFSCLKYQFNKKSSLTMEVTYLDYLAKQAGGLTDTQFKKNIYFSNRSRNWFAVNWNLWSAKFEHDFSEDTKFSFNLFGLQASRKAVGYRGNYNSDVNPVSDVDELLQLEKKYLMRDLIIGKYRNFGAEARFLSKYNLGNQKQVYLLGFKYYRAYNSEEQGAGSRGIDADFKFYEEEKDDYVNGSSFKFPNENVAFFVENIFNVTPKFSITPGIRLEYIKTESNGDFKVVYRDGAGNIYRQEQLPFNKVKERSFALFGLGLSYKYNKVIEIYGNLSQNYRSVTFSDIKTVSPSFKVDENIGDEKGGTADLGFRGKYKRYISYDIGGFALFYNDRIGETIEDKGADKGDRIRKNIGDAFIYGFEGFTTFSLADIIGMNSKKHELTSFVNLAITDSEYIRSEQAGIKGKKVEFIPYVNFKTGIKYGYKNWLSSVQFTYLSEQFTEATNARPDGQGATREGLVGEIPAYSIMDASLSYKYKNWKFETGVNNVLNEHYYTRRATGYPGPGIIPSAPRSWFVTAEFKL